MKFPIIRQVLPDNEGITDIEGDFSVSRRGFRYSNVFNFTANRLGNFCSVFLPLLEGIENPVVIELGCGPGVLGLCFDDSTLYVGLDANIAAGIYCAGDNRQVVTVDLTQEFELQPSIKADLLLCIDMWEHIEEDLIEPLLSNIQQLLKKGTQIFFVIDTMKGPGMREHITIHKEQWWVDIFRKQKRWKRLQVSNDFRDNYFNNLPTHWKNWELRKRHLLFRYMVK